MATATLPVEAVSTPSPTSESAVLLSAEEYLRLATDASVELVRGKVIEMPPPTPYHGRYCGRFLMLLGAFVEPRKLGEVVCNDAGVLTQRDPDTLRGADVAFYAAARLPGGKLPMHGLPGVVPDLVVKVRSEHDRRGDVLRKIGEYLAAGVAVVIAFDPFRTILEIHRESGVETYRDDDAWTLPDLLPGFSATVRAPVK